MEKYCRNPFYRTSDMLCYNRKANMWFSIHIPEVNIMRKSIFGSFFDFNNDGKLDLSEEFMEYQFINDVVMADDSDEEDEDIYDIL